MNLILVKMFATALALAQVTTRPESLKTEFDPINDQAAVVQLLKDGCTHMRKAFDIEDLNLDSLIDTAMEDPKAIAGEIRAFRGINFDDLMIAYKQFCGNEPFDASRFVVVIVDNASNDGTADILREFEHRVRMVHNRENRGFAGGQNQAIALCRRPPG